MDLGKIMIGIALVMLSVGMLVIAFRCNRVRSLLHGWVRE